MTPVLATIVALTNLMGTVEIDTRGARVTSYVPIGGSEVFFASETGTGGMPLCWPWFAGRGPAGSKRHGLVRDRVFKVVNDKRHASWDRELTLRLESDEETRKAFPHDFALTVSVRLTDRLTVTMTGENTGTDPFEVSEAFHPYFAVADSAQCRVDGTDTSEYRLTDPVRLRDVVSRSRTRAARTAACGGRTRKAISRSRSRRSPPMTGAISSAWRTARSRVHPTSSSRAKSTCSKGRSTCP